ncbi:MAG: CapA family protein [Chloroflexi bacterium CFX7]|nr:MAG: CapA family protein [bacterium]MCE7928339.1 CapA family protein [Chloroflexi bacterium CFX7]MCK6563230.1 CapA family protein [Dehalococcoidia bacterium]MCL4232814.1 CapA family protein [Dehalococcoidia bacterium]RIL02400.1 MAG: poly-gamma-glutamate biosynthesis protein [bacterium]
MRRFALALPAGGVALLLLAVVLWPRPASSNPVTPAAVPAANPGESATYRIVIPGISHDVARRATLAAVGDVMLARSVGEAIVTGGPGVPFAGVAAALRDADLAVANLECSISERGEPAPKGFTFRAPPLAADALAGAGIDIASLANNHILDYGPDALSDTIALLDGRGIAHAGAGEDAARARTPAIVTRGGMRIAFLSYVDVPLEWQGFDTRQWEATAAAPGVAWLHIEDVKADVAAARRLADLVVVLMHFGFEEQYSPSETQRAQARAAIDAGAVLVIGHHPHVLQPVEWYGKGLIVYSLGNFIFDGWDNPSNETAVLFAELGDEGVLSYRMAPAWIDGNGFPWLVE